jgi:hypothetical protein
MPLIHQQILVVPTNEVEITIKYLVAVKKKK